MNVYSVFPLCFQRHCGWPILNRRRNKMSPKHCFRIKFEREQMKLKMRVSSHTSALLIHWTQYNSTPKVNAQTKHMQRTDMIEWDFRISSRYNMFVVVFRIVTPWRLVGGYRSSFKRHPLELVFLQISCCFVLVFVCIEEYVSCHFVVPIVRWFFLLFSLWFYLLYSIRFR
jgi:hypothetical protein